MNPIKEFFLKKKKDSTFKKAGPGHKLNESPSPQNLSNRPQPSSSLGQRQQLSEGAQRAGAAALARIEQKQTVNWSSQATKAQARKEIEKEKASTSVPPSKPTRDIVVHDGCQSLTVSGVYFTCPLVGPEVLPKKEIKEKIRKFLYEQLEQERGLTACLILHTLNENKDKAQCGIETLARYVTNIIDNPTEEKYHKIRVNNKAFQERVVGLEGAFDYLEAVGFKKTVIEHEDFFVLQIEYLEDIDHLQMLKEALLNAEPIIPVLDRNLRVLKPSQVSIQVNLPDSFYHITAEELKREQELKTETVELMTQLRTKAMRERDQIKELHIFKFTLMRIRFPDGNFLQGTFYVHEKFLAVREFVTENLCDPDREYHLTLPGGQKVTEDGSSLLELKLVPAVILNFSWADPGNENINFLMSEVMALIEEI